MYCDKKSFFDDVGLFDEYFVSYFEDVDISFRGQLKGHKYLYVPLAVVKHKGKETSKHLESSRGFFELRNSILVWIKNLPASVLFRKRILFKLIYFNKKRFTGVSCRRLNVSALKHFLKWKPGIHLGRGLEITCNHLMQAATDANSRTVRRADE